MIGCGFVGSASVGKEALKFKKSADALKKVKLMYGNAVTADILW